MSTHKLSTAFLALPIAFSALVVLVFVIEQVLGVSFSWYGILPRKISGLQGILFSVFIHGSWQHLISNISALPFLIALLTLIYRKNYFSIFVTLYLLTGFFVWLFARESFHIGASGLIYALASFLFFGGIVSKRKATAAISFLIIFLYGGMIWGIFPTDERISWESHLFGGIAGFVGAIIFVKDKPIKILQDSDYDYQLFGFKNFVSSSYYKTVDYSFSKKKENQSFTLTISAPSNFSLSSKFS